MNDDRLPITHEGRRITLRTDTQKTIRNDLDPPSRPPGPGLWSLWPGHEARDYPDMSEFRTPREPDPGTAAEPVNGPPADGTREPAPGVEPLRLSPLLPRRQNPWLVVEIDGSPASHGALVWALREAARREATVVAVSVPDGPDGDPLGDSRRQVRAHLVAQEQLEARVLRAIAETGVHGRTRTAVLDRPVFDALTAATRGADLVMVGALGKTVLRQAVPRPPTRRLARGA